MATPEKQTTDDCGEEASADSAYDDSLSVNSRDDVRLSRERDELAEVKQDGSHSTTGPVMSLADEIKMRRRPSIKPARYEDSAETPKRQRASKDKTIRSRRGATASVSSLSHTTARREKMEPQSESERSFFGSRQGKRRISHSGSDEEITRSSATRSAARERKRMAWEMDYLEDEESGREEERGGRIAKAKYSKEKKGGRKGGASEGAESDEQQHSDAYEESDEEGRPSSSRKAVARKSARPSMAAGSSKGGGRKRETSHSEGEESEHSKASSAPRSKRRRRSGAAAKKKGAKQQQKQKQAGRVLTDSEKEELKRQSLEAIRKICIESSPDIRWNTPVPAKYVLAPIHYYETNEYFTERTVKLRYTCQRDHKPLRVGSEVFPKYEDGNIYPAIVIGFAKNDTEAHFLLERHNLDRIEKRQAAAAHQGDTVEVREFGRPAELEQGEPEPIENIDRIGEAKKRRAPKRSSKKRVEESVYDEDDEMPMPLQHDDDTAMDTGDQKGARADADCEKNDSMAEHVHDHVHGHEDEEIDWRDTELEQRALQKEKKEEERKRVEEKERRRLKKEEAARMKREEAGAVERRAADDIRRSILQQATPLSAAAEAAAAPSSALQPRPLRMAAFRIPKKSSRAEEEQEGIKTASAARLRSVDEVKEMKKAERKKEEDEGKRERPEKQEKKMKREREEEEEQIRKTAAAAVEAGIEEAMKRRQKEFEAAQKLAAQRKKEEAAGRAPRDVRSVSQHMQQQPADPEWLQQQHHGMDGVMEGDLAHPDEPEAVLKSAGNQHFQQMMGDTAQPQQQPIRPSQHTLPMMGADHRAGGGRDATPRAVPSPSDALDQQESLSVMRQVHFAPSVAAAAKTAHRSDPRINKSQRNGLQMASCSTAVSAGMGGAAAAGLPSGTSSEPRRLTTKEWMELSPPFRKLPTMNGSGASPAPHPVPPPPAEVLALLQQQQLARSRAVRGGGGPRVDLSALKLTYSWDEHGTLLLNYLDESIGRDVCPSPFPAPPAFLQHLVNTGRISDNFLLIQPQGQQQ